MAADLKFCPHCGAPVTATDDSCPKCQTDLHPYRTNDPASSSQKLNLGALYANPYREGMKRLRKREATPDKPRKWHWPWSK